MLLVGYFEGLDRDPGVAWRCSDSLSLRQFLGMGFEPAGDFDATTDGQCSCEFCQGWRAANALHSEVTSCPEVASADPELQRVVASWDALPEAIRAAVLALIGTVQGMATTLSKRPN